MQAGVYMLRSTDSASFSSAMSFDSWFGLLKSSCTMGSISKATSFLFVSSSLAKSKAPRSTVRSSFLGVPASTIQWAAVTTQFDATRVPPQLCMCESEPSEGPAFNDTIQGYFPLVESSPPTILRSPSKPHLHVDPYNKQ